MLSRISGGSVMLLMLALCACGGGGSGAGGGSGSTPGGGGTGAPAASATFSKTSLSLGTFNGGGGPSDSSITFTTNYPGSLWYRYRQTSPLVKELTVFHNTGQLGGTVNIKLMEGERLGAGTYTSTLTLDLCTDEACSTLFAGTPVQISITYEVTGAAQPMTQVNWSTSQPTQQLDYDTSLATSPSFELRANIGNVPVLKPLYIGRSPSQTGLVTAVNYTPPPAGSPDVNAGMPFTVSLKPPATLGSGVFRDSITLRVCLDSGCAAEVSGSPYVLEFSVVVVATEGAQVRSVNRAPDHGAQAMAWSTATGRLYVASADEAGPTAPGQLLVLDPATLQTTGSFTFNNGELGALSMASDGGGLYASFRNDRPIHHLALPGLVNDFRLDPPAKPPGSGYYLASMLPLSGQPQSLLVSRLNGDAGDVSVYDGTAQRAVVAAVDPQVELPPVLVAGGAADTFYGYRRAGGATGVRSVDRYTVTAAGVTDTATFADPWQPNVVGLPEKLQFANGLLFDEYGRALDPATGAVLRTLALPAGFALQDYIVDGAHNRLLARVGRAPSSRPYLMSFALDTFNLLAVARLYDPNGYELLAPRYGASMILWGSDGLAITDSRQIVVLSGSFFTSYTGAP